MDVVRFGRAVRALRRRRGWRQIDLAEAARLSRGALARVERGRADRVTVATLERLVAPLGARLTIRIDWNGEALDRLLDSAHAAIVERVVRLLTAAGWSCATEVSFNRYGERGSIDILAWHNATRCLLVVEVKSAVPDLQLMLSTLDRKARLAPEIARDRGWAPRAGAARLLVLPDDRTTRRRVAQHGATFASALPARGSAVRRWLQQPADGPFGGMQFVSGESDTATRHRVRRRVR